MEVNYSIAINPTAHIYYGLGHEYNQSLIYLHQLYWSFSFSLQTVKLVLNTFSIFKVVCFLSLGAFDGGFTNVMPSQRVNQTKLKVCEVNMSRNIFKKVKNKINVCTHIYM